MIYFVFTCAVPSLGLCTFYFIPMCRKRRIIDDCIIIIIIIINYSECHFENGS